MRPRLRPEWPWNRSLPHPTRITKPRQRPKDRVSITSEAALRPPPSPVDPAPSVLMELAGPPPLPPRGRLERLGRDGAISQSFGSARQLGPRPDRWEYCWGWLKSARFLLGFPGVHSGSQPECPRFGLGPARNDHDSAVYFRRVGPLTVGDPSCQQVSRRSIVRVQRRRQVLLGRSPPVSMVGDSAKQATRSLTHGW